MNQYDEEFINVFNESYPFDRYIIKNPKPIGTLFDDCVLTEIFIPKFDVKPLLDKNGKLITFTSFKIEDIQVKIKGSIGEVRIGYFDFEEHIRETIRHIFINDIGHYEYECLYVDYEDLSDVKRELEIQKKLLQEKYGTYQIKKSIRDNLV